MGCGHVFCKMYGSRLPNKTPSYPLKQQVVLATDQVNARSILMYQQNLDKIAELSSHSAMGVSGPNCDLVNFSE